MDLGSILLGLALLLVVAFIVARPLLLGTSGRDRPAPGGPTRDLLFERERLLVQLRDVDFDHATGKLNDLDHAAQRAALVAQGVAILKQLDALGHSVAGVNGAALPIDDEIEAAILAARGLPPIAPASMRSEPAAAPAPTLLTCANCGRTAPVGDQFCGNCGQRLPTAA